ncbi:hypothetical protein CYMTET_36363 [Cymbomonas tetramitiformis]|uniref:Uncharacterized protein n=1 Tax=Cymbomonas tetramitiformis TaxID=36881 RepID=A0AAE0F7K8_9CHLO|nr:hypothetical protein CYMTET_36363 [Cymbomonas tetramitiformis]
MGPCEMAANLDISRLYNSNIYMWRPSPSGGKATGDIDVSAYGFAVEEDPDDDDDGVLQQLQQLTAQLSDPKGCCYADMVVRHGR